VGTEQKNILTVNAGSSSVKLVLTNLESLEQILEASVTNIAQPNSKLTVLRASSPAETEAATASNHQEAVEAVLKFLGDAFSPNGLAAIGHRVVHGGPDFNEPTMVDSVVLEKLNGIVEFDPVHMPASLALIKFFSSHFSGTPQVVCFDTEFYKDLPHVARMLPLPRKFESLGLRRYGFHGLSYEYLLDDFRKIAGDDAANGKVIFAHLGSGASLSALKDGKIVDTTMSFTPVSGIPMSSRSGNLDPGIVDFLYRKAGINSEQFNHIVNFDSGLLGVSELSSDMELLLQQYENNSKAADAVELFCYEARKAIGGLCSVLGGVNSIVFSGGMGETAPTIRAKICEGLSYLGVKLDQKRNEQHIFLISSDDSAVGVHVMHTDEAVIIAKKTKMLLMGTNG
jgi:acetate kinase